VDREMIIHREVNTYVRSKSELPQVEIVDIDEHFLGHGSHFNDPANRYYHPEDPTYWYVNTIEPNTRGGHELRKLFWKALENSGKAKSNP
jgi:hypothetical protein